MTEQPQRYRLPADRRQRIVELARERGSVAVSDLAADFGVSELTIRRDIAGLCERGLLTRVRGGARPYTGYEPAAAEGGAARFRLGMVVPSLTYYWPQIISGARVAAGRAAAELLVRPATYEPASQRRQIQAFLDAGQVDGLLVAPETGGREGYEMLRWLDGLGMPVVLVERRAPSALGLQFLQWVGTDHEFGAVLAVQHLHRQGHERIGFAASTGSPTSLSLRRGFRRALDALRLGEPTMDMLYSTGAPPHVEGIDGVLDECERTGTTALLVHADPQAVELEQMCADRGLRIPEDLAIVTYDDEVAEHGNPPITALRPAKGHVGRLAVETLVARLVEGRQRPVQRLHVLPELHVRESSVAPPD